MSDVHSMGQSENANMAGMRTLLIGTPFAVSEVAASLLHASPTPVLVGCLLPASRNGKIVIPRQFPTKVLGDFNKLAHAIAAHRIQQVLVCLPVSLADHFAPIRDTLKATTGITWRVLTPLADQLAGRMAFLPDGTPVDDSICDLQVKVTVGDIQPPSTRRGEIDVQALIDRQPRPLDEQAIAQTITGNTVMITGAGGSIGSELARIVCRFHPDRLVMVERSENALFEIDREIGRAYPDLKRSAVLHDITDAPRTMAMVAMHRPHVIFHTAAHKHVPMMEDHPAHAVENNFYGSRAMADAADTNGVSRFVMISTDKAVNPTSIMGATKRLAELYIQYLNTQSETVYSMVRFGNVLGSACSVLPIWGKQLRHGHSITVTDPQMTRFFMTIPEAAGLVLQSATMTGQVDGYTGGGEIFLLDMGKPVRILDLAERFIRGQGYTPGVDAKIEFTGIRPGEKLHEQLTYDSEDVIETSHQSLRILRTRPPLKAAILQAIESFDRIREVPRGVEGGHHWQNADRDTIVTALKAAIPEMTVSDAALAAS